MTIIEAFENNPRAITRSFAPILKLSQIGQEYSIVINENEYLITVRFVRTEKGFIQNIEIKPIGASIPYDKDLTLQFIENRYHSYWKNHIPIDFRVNKVDLINFFGNNALKSILIDGGTDQLELNIQNTNSSIKIQSCKKVKLEDIKCQSLNVGDVDELNLTNIASIDGKSSVTITNCDKVTTNDLSGKEFKLVGQSDRVNLTHSKFENVRLIESTFNKVTFFDFDIKNLRIEQGNRENLEGYIMFTDSNLSGSFALQDCQLGKPSFMARLWKRIFNKPIKSPMYLDIMDNRINPKNVEFKEVDWYYNGILDNKKYPEGKRKIINQVKNFYSTNDDILNTQLLYSFEKIWYYHHNKSSVPLFLSKWSNNFGLSLWLPLLWIFGLILVESCVLLWLSWNCWEILKENWGVFAHLINPTHKTSIFLDVFEDKCSPPLSYRNWLPVVDNFFRILIGYAIFQFANAFRYKFKLR